MIIKCFHGLKWVYLEIYTEDIKVWANIIKARGF